MLLENLCMGCMHERGDNRICPHCGWIEGTQPESPVHLPPRTRLGRRYCLGRVLGQGGFGITYLGWDTVLKTRVAIKEYLPQQIASRNTGEVEVIPWQSQGRRESFAYGRQKFLDEARTLAKMDDNPGIVAVRDYFEANGTAYLVMPFLDGMNFKDYLNRKGGRISFEDALPIMDSVLASLEEVHARGLLHRDVTPDNIFITRNRQVKLLDFGAARYAVGDQSQSLSVILKPGYAPEEQYRSKGQQGPWTDEYAAAATLYRAITGRIPPEALERIHNDSLAAPSQLKAKIPPRAEAALMKALSVRQQHRYQSIGEFRQALLAGAASPAGQGPSEGPAAPVLPGAVPAPGAQPGQQPGQHPAGAGAARPGPLPSRAVSTPPGGKAVSGFAGTGSTADDPPAGPKAPAPGPAPGPMPGPVPGPVAGPVRGPVPGPMPGRPYPEEGRTMPGPMPGPGFGPVQVPVPGSAPHSGSYQAGPGAPRPGKPQSRPRKSKARLVGAVFLALAGLILLSWATGIVKINIGPRIARLDYPDGSAYNGEYDDELAYSGDYLDGKFHGRGTYTWHKEKDFKIEYEGNFRYGLMEGSGEYSGRYGEVYSGSFSEGLFNGTGKLSHEDGYVYRGSFVDGLADGEGESSFADGTIYQGQFDRGVMEGEGIITWPDGSYYTGEFAGDQPHGMGALYDEYDELIYQGPFRDGQPVAQ